MLGGELKPPPAGLTVELLEHALRAAAADVRAPLPHELGTGTIAWGAELDVRVLDMDERRQVAGYLAKYATKSTELAGSVLHPVTAAAVDQLPVREHVRAFLRAAFQLQADPALAARRFGPCAHALGHRGHCVTKSRGYSITFKALRQAREQHVHQQLLEHAKDPAQRAIAAAEQRVAHLRFAGQGHITAADAYLAASAAARAREEREAAREALRDQRSMRREYRWATPQR